MTSVCAHCTATFAGASLAPDRTAAGEGLRCLGGVAGAGCPHQVIAAGSGPVAARAAASKRANAAPGNIKASTTAAYRAISTKHVPRRPAEFECRFNRRHDPAAMTPRTTGADATGARTPAQVG